MTRSRPLALAAAARTAFASSARAIISAKLNFKVAGVSKGAREAIEKAGGSVELIERKDKAELAKAKKGKAREARLADKSSKQDAARAAK